MEVFMLCVDDKKIAWFTMLPNIIFEMGLDVYEIAAYAFFKRVAGDSGGACWHSASSMADKLGISAGKLSQVKKSLQERGLIRIAEVTEATNIGGHQLAPKAGRPAHVIYITDIWEKNSNHFQPNQSSPGEVQSSPGEVYPPEEGQSSPGELKNIYIRTNTIRTNTNTIAEMEKEGSSPNGNEPALRALPLFKQEENPLDQREIMLEQILEQTVPLVLEDAAALSEGMVHRLLDLEKRGAGRKTLIAGLERHLRSRNKPEKPEWEVIFSDITGTWPNSGQKELMENTFAETFDPDLWRDVVYGYHITMGWSPRSIGKMLDWYKRKEVPGKQHKRSARMFDAKSASSYS